MTPDISATLCQSSSVLCFVLFSCPCSGWREGALEDAQTRVIDVATATLSRGIWWPLPAGHSANVAQFVVSLICHEGALLTRVQSVLLVLLSRAEGFPRLL